MRLGFDFHPEARAEFVADVTWYDAREIGVGERFEVAVRGPWGAASYRRPDGRGGDRTVRLDCDVRAL